MDLFHPRLRKPPLHNVPAPAHLLGIVDLLQPLLDEIPWPNRLSPHESVVPWPDKWNCREIILSVSLYNCRREFLWSVCLHNNWRDFWRPILYGIWMSNIQRLHENQLRRASKKNFKLQRPRVKARLLLARIVRCPDAISCLILSYVDTFRTWKTIARSCKKMKLRPPAKKK